MPFDPDIELGNNQRADLISFLRDNVVGLFGYELPTPENVVIERPEED